MNKIFNIPFWEIRGIIESAGASEVRFERAINIKKTRKTAVCFYAYKFILYYKFICIDTS